MEILVWIQRRERIFLNQSWASPGGLVVNNLPATWETWVRSLGQEDPLEKGTGTHSSILAWKIPRAEEPVRVQSLGLQGQTTEVTEHAQRS